MERSEPSLVPEWYKGASGSNFTPLSGSSHSGADEINTGFSSKNRLSITFCEQDALRSLSFTERTSSSFHRSACSNGSMGREVLPLRAYSSFGRSHRDRNRGRGKDLELCDRNRPLLEDNDFLNNTDPLATNKLEKDSLWQSHSVVSGSGDSWLKRPAHDSGNDVSSGGSIITGISKSSFERDFPTLGAEEKHVGSDLASVAAPGLSNVIHNLPMTALNIIGGDGWTSALVEVPPTVGGNGPIVSSVLPTSSALTIVSGLSSGLNMAETLAQAPTRVHTSSPLPNDSQKIEELHRLQILKLRPVMPSMPKNLGLYSAEKSKTKTARTAEINASKTGQLSSSQLLIHSVPPAVRSDAYKISQPGNFQVLNRERNSLSPGKDIPKPKNFSRVLNTPTGIPPVAIQPLKGSTNPTLSPKKLPSQLQNRNDFFNSLRKKTYSGQQHSNANTVSNNETSSSFAADSSPDNKKNVFHRSAENGNCDELEEPDKLAPDEEEEAFLRSMGWEDNDGIEALTHEEIESFLSLYKMQRPASKLNL